MTYPTTIVLPLITNPIGISLIRYILIQFAIVMLLTVAKSLINDRRKQKYCKAEATATISRYAQTNKNQRLAVLTYDHPVYGPQELVRAKINHALPVIGNTYQIYCNSLNPVDVYLAVEMPVRVKSKIALIIISAILLALAIII